MRVLALFPVLLLTIALPIRADALPSEQIALKDAVHRPSGPAPDTADYVRNAAIGNLFEIAAAKIARVKSRSNDVRRYALMILADNAAMEQELATTLQTDAMTPPANMDPAHMALIRQLDGSTGPDFDREYMQDEVRGQQSALSLEAGYAHSGRDENMHGLARGIASRIHMHLTLAERVLREQNQKTASAL